MAETRSNFLNACVNGNVELVKQLHPSLPANDTPLVHEAFTRAIDNRRLETVEFLLQNAPPALAARIPDSVLLRALDAGAEMYALFIRNEAEAARRQFGHMGHVLSLAVGKNDLQLVRLLLDSGASSADSSFLHRPLLEVAQEMKHINKDIITMLVGKT